MAAGTSDIDDLFQLPLSEFTAARNALAAKLKAAGRTDDAARVKALAKPPVSAWAVNQLYWRHRKAFDRLIAAGERLRKTQASQLAEKGGEMRALLEARRLALSELMRRAVALRRDAGHPSTPELMHRITAMLEALATYGHQALEPPAGRLTGDVDPPGFEILAALVPRKGGRARGSEPTRVIPFRRQREPRAAGKKVDPTEAKRQREEERKAQRRAAAAALRNAERALRDARKTAEQAEAQLKKAAARAKETEREKAALEKRFEKAAADADQARQEARRIASEAEEAVQAVADAEHALDQARRILDDLA